MFLFNNAVKNTLKQDSIDKLSFFSNGHEITGNEGLTRNKYSLITVINRPSEGKQSEHSLSIINLRPYELLIRINIYSVLFSKQNIINLERFLNYCDKNKSFSFETCGLEIASLLILELFNQQIGNKWFHLNYCDL